MLGGGSIIAILYLGFAAVIFSLMSIAKSTDDANELFEFDAENTPSPHFRIDGARGSPVPRATSSVQSIVSIPLNIT